MIDKLQNAATVLQYISYSAEQHMNLFVGVLKFYLPQLFIHLYSGIQKKYRRPQKWKSISTSWPAIIKLLHCTKENEKKKKKKESIFWFAFIIWISNDQNEWNLLFSDRRSPDNKGNSFYFEINIHNFLLLFQVRGTHSFNSQSQLLDFPSVLLFLWCLQSNSIKKNVWRYYVVGYLSQNTLQMPLVTLFPHFSILKTNKRCLSLL